MSIKTPKLFSGELFASKYSLSSHDFHEDENGNLICPSLPNLTEADLLDCVSEIKIELSPSQQIILADGIDVAVVNISGKPSATVNYTINGVPFQSTLDQSGQDIINLSCDTPNTTLVVLAETARAVVYAVEVPL